MYLIKDIYTTYNHTYTNPLGPWCWMQWKHAYERTILQPPHSWDSQNTHNPCRAGVTAPNAITPSLTNACTPIHTQPFNSCAAQFTFSQTRFRQKSDFHPLMCTQKCLYLLREQMHACVSVCVSTSMCACV